MARVPPCSAAREPRCPALRPVRRPALQLASRAALPLGPRIALPCSPGGAPCCPAQRAPHCPARRSVLQPTRHALQPARRTLLPRASRPTAARASRPAAPCVTPCCPVQRAPRCPAAPALPHSPAPLSRPAATTTAAAGGGAAGSAGGAAGAGGAGDAAGSAGGAAGSAGGAAGSAGGAAGSAGAARGGQQQTLPLPDNPTPQQLREWVIQRGSPGGGGFGFMGTAQRRQQRPQGTFSLRRLRDCASQRCVPGCVEAAALGSSESIAAPGASESVAALGARESADALRASASTATGPASVEALHTFTLDSGASHCFFRGCTTVTPLAAPVPVSLADTTGGPVVAQASTVLPCPAFPSGSLSGLHLPVFSTNLLSNAVLHDVWVRWLRRAGCLRLVSLQRLARVGMHSRLLFSGLPRSLPSLSCSPAFPCLPYIEGRQRAAPHSSEFPPTIAPLQTLHMDVWGPAPVSGMDQERYFLLVVDDYTRYTTVFPLRRKADVSGVLIPWICATRHQLRGRFWRDLPVLRLLSDRGGEFSSSLLEEFCRDEGIHQTFTLSASPQQNGIAERRIGLIMEVARTSMIHADAPHFLWPFVVQYAAHQLNLRPRVSEPETSTTLRWTGKFGDASVFQVWGAHSFVRDAKASKLSSRTLLCVFLQATLARIPPDPPPLDEPEEISSDSSGPAEGGDLAADDMATTRRSPRLEIPPGFPPRSSSPPQQPSTVGGDTRGVDSGGAVSPRDVGAEGDPAGGPGAGQPQQPGLLETLSPQQIRAWIIRRGSPGGGGYDAASTGAPISGSTSGVGGAIGGAGGATGGVGGTAGGAGGATGGTAGAGGAGGTAGGAGGEPGARGAGATRAGGTAGTGGAGGTGGAASTGGAGGTAGGAGGATGAGGAGAAGVGGAGCAASAGGPGVAGAGGATSTGGAGAAGAGGATGARGTGAAGAGAACAGGVRAAAAGDAAGAGGTGAAGAGGAGAAAAGGAGPVCALRHLLGLPLAATEFLVAGTTPPLLFPPTDQSQPQLLPHSPLPGTTPYTKVTESLTKRRELESRASTLEHRETESRAFVPTRLCRVRRPRAPAVPGTHDMTLRPSSVPLCVVLPSPPASSLPDVADPPSGLACASSPTVTRFLPTVVTDPTFSYPAASALVAELADFAAAYRLDYLASLLSDPDPACPPSVRGEVALGCDVLEDRQEELEYLAAAVPHLATMLLTPEGDPDALDILTLRSYREAISGEYSSQWKTAMDTEMAS
ncbi:unnamed protein product [Closterium sp. NIES-53]